MPPAFGTPTVDAPAIDYIAYSPRDESCEYGLVKVTLSGSVVSRQPLETNFENYLTTTLQSDTRLWNGVSGLSGIAYSAKGSVSGGTLGASQRELTPEDVKAFTETLKRLAEVGEDAGRHRKLQKGIDVHAKIANALEGAAMDQKRKLHLLEAVCSKGSLDLKSADSGDESGAFKGLDVSPTGIGGGVDGKHQNLGLGVGQLSIQDEREAQGEYLEAVAELENLTNAISRSKTKTAVIWEELDELQTANTRRAAILERIFGNDPAGAFALKVLERRSTGQGDQIEPGLRTQSDRAASLAASRNDAFIKHHRILCAHVDAKKGLLHLHVIESVLKGILEHLTDAMSTSTAGPRISTAAAESMPISPTYRIRYVRKLRESADRILPDIARYAPYCGLQINGVPVDIAIQAEEKAGGGGSFPTLLPKFSKLSLVASFKTTDKITILYNDAKTAYTDVNHAYDTQLALIKKTTADLLQAAKVLEEEEHNLGSLRCRMLLSKSIGAKLHRTASAR